MDIDKLFNVDQVPDSLFDSVNNTVSEARAMQKKKAAENAQAVIQALQKMKGDLEGKYDNIYSMLESRVASIQDGRDGMDGRDGRNGRDGKDGQAGVPGRDGRDGVDGINGVDGEDGVSITDIRLDFDNSLVITLSNGREINAGEILPPDIADRLKITINSGSGGGGVTTDSVATFTNKRIDPRVLTQTSVATLSPDISAYDQYNLTAQAAGLTVAAPIGVPVNGNKLIFRILDNGTSRAISWNATYTVIGTTLPTTTTTSKMLYVGCIYNADTTRWDVVAVTTQA
jgi:hypothetical protein